MPTAYKNVYQFKVSLEGIKPTIWRRIQLPETSSFLDLHDAIQDAMGWQHCHLHQFKIINPKSGSHALIGIPDDEWGETVLSGEKQLIQRYFSLQNKRALYEYDFGDGWRHKLLLEKIVPREPGVAYPIALAGERACPPEDCGGPWGYENLLNIIKNPKHEEYKSMMDWLEENFDPEAFQVSDIRFGASKKH